MREKLELWANAYNAALTGLLASYMHEMQTFTPNNVHVITEQAKAFANKAEEDFDWYRTNLDIGNS
jgi:hypothetical protein